MTARKLLLASTLALGALASGTVLAGCSAAGPQAAPAASAATGTPTGSPSGSATTPAASATASAPQPSGPSTSSDAPSAAVSVPVVAPTLRSLQIDGPGFSGTLTADEAKARDAIYRVLPVLLNETSAKYASPTGARDELLSQGLITAHMAGSFAAAFTPGQGQVHAAGFTVQTTGMECVLHTSAGSALQSGHVFCYLSRQYVGPDGAAVTDARWTASGQPDAINPNELANASVTMADEGGTWKVDAVQFGA